ncbi:hypothetical protein [Micromonospora aurantiaca (nom. illeg.)]|uniref:hypothetical protein n=1 Tax=Micromonospora aurantiaca (nom. illeg.) TaxID=47850 RepID=UPI000827D386|nr:hypothetical protein [Micromonospora aurantiaca]SCL33497.1 hypothetical protein GA0070615_2300 [Micromonospora aurantiaca]
MPACYPTTIRSLTAQGYRHQPRALRCAHGLSRPFWCRTCRQLPHRDGCEFTGLDHALIAARHGVRYLFTWIYADPADADVWAADYANRHGLDYRIDHPDDLEAYCPGVVSVRYHRKPKSGDRTAIVLPNLRIAAGARH